MSTATPAFDHHTPTTGLSKHPTNVRRPWSVRFVLWLLHSIPTVIVLTSLAAVGWWGHHTNWKLPKFSELTGQPSGAAEVPEDWCAEHKVPESECVLCAEEDGKRPKRTFHGWCKVHGVAECPFEHPDVVQLFNPPAVTETQLQAAAEALAARPRVKNNSVCKLHERLVQLASLSAQQKAGIEVEPASEEAVVEAIAASGTIQLDPGRVAHISSRTPGTLWRVDKTIGDRVEPGDVLAFVDSADVGKAKTELMQALTERSLAQVNLDRLSTAASRGATSERSLREAQATMRAAEIRVVTASQTLANLGLSVSEEELTDGRPQVIAGKLRLLGVPPALRSTVTAATGSSNLLPILAHISGTLVQRDAVRGEVVAPSDRLLTIADASTLWLVLNAPQEESRHLQLGQKVLFKPDGSAEEIATRVTWISPAVDDKTRTVEVRAEIANADGRLKSASFGAGRIVLREQPAAVVVPNAAVHWEGDCHIVFVRDKDYLKEGSPKLFHVRKVRVGVKTDQFTEIIAGVRSGEVVATKGSESLRATLLSENMGEGCCGGHSHGAGGHHHDH